MEPKLALRLKPLGASIYPYVKCLPGCLTLFVLEINLRRLRLGFSCITAYLEYPALRCNV